MRTVLAISLVSIPLIIREGDSGPPVGVPRPASVPAATVPMAKPAWPKEWPSLNLVLPITLAGIQTMGTGYVDYSIPASPDWYSCQGDGCGPAFSLTGCAGDQYQCPPAPKPACTGGECPPSSYPPACTGSQCPRDPPACTGAPPPLAPQEPDNRVPPGFTFLSPEGQPLDNVSLSQPFLVELRVRTEDVKIDQTSPTFSQETMPVTLRTADGKEEKITLRVVGTETGVVVYRTPGPVSIGGEAGRMDYAGTVNNLGLEFETGSEVHIVALSAANILNGVSAVRVYANPIQQGIAANRDLLNQVAQALQAERKVAEGLLANPEFSADPDRVKEAQSWLQRISAQEAMVTQAQGYIQNAPFPIYQLRYSSFFLNRLLTTGPNGLELAPEAPTPFALVNDLGTLAKSLQDDYGTNGIVSPAAMGVISGYVMGGTTTFAHLTGGAAISQLLSGKDLFGNDASRGWAAIELGATVAMIVLPPKIIDFLAGRGINNFGFEISIGGKPAHIYPAKLAAAIEGVGTVPGARPVTRRPVKLPAAIEGVPTLPGTRPVTRRLPGTGELPAGASVSNLPVRRQGMPAQEAQYWKAQVESWRPTNPTPDSRALESMVFQQAQDAFSSMDNAIAAARSQGVPQNVLDDLLTRARNFETLADASALVTREVDLLLLTRQGQRIFVSPGDAGAMSQLFSPGQVGQMSSCDLSVVDRVTAKAHIEAFEPTPRWTPDEYQVLVELDRRIASGEDLSTWRRAEVDGTGLPDDAFQFRGFEPVFGPGDLGAIRAAASRPLRLQTEGVTPRSTTLPSPAVSSPRSVPPTMNPVLAPGAFGGPSGLGSGSSPIEIVFRSTGGSTGEVLEAAVVNYGGPILLRTSGLVLEPASPDQVQQSSSRLDEIFKALHGGGTINQQVPAAFPGDGSARSWGPSLIGPNEPGLDGSAVPMRGRVVRLVLDAYCLEFLNAVPLAGQVFRIASQARQRAAARFRGILAASQRLQEMGSLHPDGNPASYFHSLRQWATWVEERKLGRGAFESEFLKHAQRNFAAAGRPWTAEVESAVRVLLPNRWRDVSAVLEAAGTGGGG